MSKSLSQLYNANRITVDADFPSGKFKNESSEDAEDGTPLEKGWQNEYLESESRASYIDAGFSHNNVSDVPERSQRYAARRFVNGRTTRPAQSGISGVCDGFVSHQWHDPSVSPNAIDLGATVTDSCMGWDHYNHRPMVYYATGALVRVVQGLWNYSAGSLVSSAYALQFNATVSDVLSVCSDGSNLFVAWRRDSDGHIVISKFFTNPFTGVATWQVGTGIIYPDDANMFYSKLIIASPTKLAMSMYSDSSPMRTYVAIIDRNTGFAAFGEGNNLVPSVSLEYMQFGNIVSDGDHVFWIVKAGTDPSTYWLSSAKISAPSTSDYTQHTILPAIDTDVEAEKIPTSLVNVGGTTGTVAWFKADGTIGLFSKSDDDVGGGIEPTSFYEYDPNPDGYATIAGSDGLNAWVALHYNHVTASPSPIPAMTMVKVPLGELASRYMQSSLVINRVVDHSFIGIDDGDLESEYRAGSVLFDGHDLIVVKRTGNLYRVCNTAAR